MLAENSNTRYSVEELKDKQNQGWERLFPDNPELENPFIN